MRKRGVLVSVFDLRDILWGLIWIADDPSAVDGMPVGLQVIGRRLQEEKVLAMVARVLEAVN